jgi:hypothetical protein
MRRSLPLAVLLAVSLAGPAHAATVVKRYDPWTPDGDPVLKRYLHGSAECTQASRVSSRQDAWRCVSGTTTLDPCFASPTDEEVFCVKAPWARSGHLLGALLEPDTHGASTAPDAWALRVRGRRCKYIPGPATRRGATYRCGKRRFLFGQPKRSRPNWTIRIGSNRRNARRARIRTAWT